MVDDAAAQLCVRGAGDSPAVEVLVQARDAPGPSGYGLLYKVDGEIVDPPSGPEIDSVVLQDRAALLAFLAEIVGGQTGPVTVVCLRPRLKRLRELLGAKPGVSPIDVDLSVPG